MAEKRGRPTRLTPNLHQAVVQAVAGGVPVIQAALINGIGQTTIKDWLRRGEGRHASRPYNTEYHVFAEDIRRAQAQDEAARLLRIRQAGQGGVVVREKTTTFKDGRVVHEVERSAPDWRSDAWHLERRIPERYALKTQVDVTVLVRRMAQRLAEEHGVDAEEIILEAQRLIAERPSDGT